MKLETFGEAEFLVLVGVVTCPRCGEDVEIWNEYAEAACEYCDYRVFRKERIVH